MKKLLSGSTLRWRERSGLRFSEDEKAAHWENGRPSRLSDGREPRHRV